MNQKSAMVIAAALVLPGILLGAQAPGQSATSPQRTPPGQAFVTQTATAGMAEVELGRLATEKTGNAKVSAFGHQMIADHGKAGNELRGLAASKQITLPTTIDSNHQATRDRLAKLSGEAFDRAYVAEMVAAHQKAVADLTAESNGGTDSDVRAWAAKTLPTIQAHLKMVQDLQKEIGVPPAGTSK